MIHKSKPQVSIVIPLYNKVNYIERTILSVCQQTFQNFEIIVVDDESTDSGDLIVEQLMVKESRISLLRRSNGGQSAARNTGIEASQGNLVAFLDADDHWEPDYLQALVSLQERFPEAGLYATGYRTVYDGFEVEVTISSEQNESIQYLLYDYFRRSQGCSFVWVSAMAIPKFVLNELGGFLMGEQIQGDSEMISRVALYYQIAYDRRPLAIYRADAQGRQNPRRDRKPQTPPFARTFNQASQQAHLTQHVIDQAPEYINRLWIQYIRLLVALHKRQMIQTVLRRELTHTKQYRLRAWYFRLAASVFPMSLFHFLNRLLYSKYFMFLDKPLHKRCGVQVTKVKKR